MNVFGDVSQECEYLAQRDAGLRVAMRAIKAPVIRRRKAGFPGMFGIITAQQVSVPSAQAIWARCVAGVKPMTAARANDMGEVALRDLGLTRQKANYVYALANALVNGHYSFRGLSAMDDITASNHLQKIKGVGPWSAGIYLLFCEGRINIWPPGDVALEHSYGHAIGAEKKPSSNYLNQQAEHWHPYKGLAAHILWTYYAHLLGRQPI